MDVWEILNAVYEPMFQRVQLLGRKIAVAGYNAKWSWYNLHASRRGEKYLVEFFPIPVISVGTWCDVILELDSICVDAHLTNEQARNFRWNRVPWPFEVYGLEDYTEDLYRPGMDLDELPGRIERYGREVGLAIPLSLDCRDEVIVEIADACRKWDTHLK